MSKIQKTDYQKLTPELRRFVDLLVRGKNATAAVRILRPDSTQPSVIGCKWKAMPEVKAARIEREEDAMEDAGITNTQVLLGIARIANLNLKELVHEDGQPKALHELSDDVATALQAIEVDVIGKRTKRTKYRLSSKLEAFKLLGQNLKLFTDNIDLRTPDGIIVEVVKFAGGTDANQDTGV